MDGAAEESLYYDDDDRFTTDVGNRCMNVMRDNLQVPIRARDHRHRLVDAGASASVADQRHL